MADVSSKESLRLLAEARAVLSGFLSLHFLSLPDQAFVRQVRSGDFQSFLEQLARDENIQAEISQGARLMSSFLKERAGSGEAQLSETLGVDRTRLYRGVSPTYGPPPPYEAVWNSDAVKQNEFLQRIARIYQEDGLTPSADIHERLDYLGIELAYIEHLARAEAKKLESGKIRSADKLRERQKMFLHEHLLNWLPKFVEKALLYAGTDFYRGHLLMLRGFVSEQAEILSTIASAAPE